MAARGARLTVKRKGTCDPVAGLIPDMTLINDRTAQTDAPVLDVVSERWSPRIYDGHSPVNEDALRKCPRGRPLGTVRL